MPSKGLSGPQGCPSRCPVQPLCSVRCATVLNNIEAAMAGLALSASMNIVVNLQLAVDMSVQVESRMNAVERIKVRWG